MAATLLFIVVLIALCAGLSAVIFCIWIFWSAARAIPKPYRMRWPWLIWLLLLPIQLRVLDQVLPLVTLVPLTRSYRRFFRENQIKGAGDCGFGLAMAYWLLSLLELLFLSQPLGLIPPATSPIFHTFVMDIFSVTVIGRACGWALLLFLAIRMWFLRRAVLQVQRRPESPVAMREVAEKNLNVQEPLRKKMSFGILAAMVVLLAADQYWVHAWRVIPVGHATTRLTGPIGKAGGIDYLAALDQMEARGVRPKNNALPLLIQAAGPECFNTRYGDGKWVMRKLGMPPFSKNSESFITFTRWLKKHPLPLPKTRKNQPKWTLESRLENRFEEHPWTARQFPSVAEWIKTNARALRLFSEAMKKQRYYIPLRSYDGSVVGVQRPDQSMIASLRSLACADAMFLLGSDEPMPAIHEAHDVRCLARLFSQSPGTTSCLQAISINASSLALDRALANSGRLSEPQLRKLLARVNNCTQLPPLSTALNYARYDALDSLTGAERDGLALEFGPSTFRTLQQYLLPINYANLLRETNRLFDAEVVASKASDFRKRLAQLDIADQRFRAFSGYERLGITGTIEAVRPVVFGGTTANFVLRSLFRPLDVLVSEFGPNGAEIGVFYARAATRCRLTKLSIALALYKRQHHQYPATISRLTPHYFKTIPDNAFTGKPIRYILVNSGRGFLLSCNQPRIKVTRPALNFGGGNTSTPPRKVQVRGGDWKVHATN